MVGSCQACNMRFASLEEMREHYTTDFHVANVRARVEGEAKLSAAEFRRRTMADDDSKPIFNCKLCKKKFHSVQTLQSHVKSTEHLMRKEQRIIERDSVAGSALSSTSLGSAALGLHRRHRAHLRARAKAKEMVDNDRTLAEVEAEEAEEAAAAAGKKVKRAKAASSLKVTDEDRTVTASGRAKVSFEDREADVSETRCLFCGMHNKTMKANLKHMLIAHDFQIPLAERVIDMRLLLQYLGRKLNGLMCLVCGENTKRFETLEALRAHMEAANHQRLVLTSEYNEFYEGALDDGEAAVLPGLQEDGSTALVVRSGSGSEAKMKRLFKRDHHAPLANKKLLETPQQAVDRRMITHQGARDTQIMLREQRQLTQKERTKHFKSMNKLYNHQKLHLLRVGMKKLWKKGYDGDGVMNLL